jgi:hypothetical protein
MLSSLVNLGEQLFRARFRIREFKISNILKPDLCDRKICEFSHVRKSPCESNWSPIAIASRGMLMRYSALEE